MILPCSSYAAYVRPNHFMDKKGWERIHEIKKFQALHNLTVTGKLDENTKKMLRNDKMFVKDTITSPPSTGPWIAVNKTQKILTFYSGTSPKYKFPVALGTSETPTPSAKTKIVNKAKNPAWGGMGGKYTPTQADDPKNPLGERWMGLGLTGYGIHGTIYPKQIGGYVSNGCIRMFNYDIETFIFPNSKVGMPVWLGTDEELRAWGVSQDWGEMVEKPKEDAKTEKTEKTEKKQEVKPVEEEIIVKENLIF